MCSECFLQHLSCFDPKGLSIVNLHTAKDESLLSSFHVKNISLHAGSAFSFLCCSPQMEAGFLGKMDESMSGASNVLDKPGVAHRAQK